VILCILCYNDIRKKKEEIITKRKGNDMSSQEIPSFLRRKKDQHASTSRVIRKKQFNKTKLLKEYVCHLPNVWKKAEYSHIMIGSTFPCVNSICGYRAVFWKKVSKGKNQNKITFRFPTLDRIYFVAEREFTKAIKETYYESN
tara:strand:- start:225 stop:653 length:429 start_codon:yes stop_codon:yes gene_type:complete